MKAERKKAREELDVVNVVEWRRYDNGDRWFLLVRRPDEGEFFSDMLSRSCLTYARLPQVF
jgi:hypothetical protein